MSDSKISSPHQSQPVRVAGEPGDHARAAMLMIHELAAYALLVIVALHILAVLYHQFVLRDQLIARM